MEGSADRWIKIKINSWDLIGGGFHRRGRSSTGNCVAPIAVRSCGMNGCDLIRRSAIGGVKGLGTRNSESLKCDGDGGLKPLADGLGPRSYGEKGARGLSKKRLRPYIKNEGFGLK